MKNVSSKIYWLIGFLSGLIFFTILILLIFLLQAFVFQFMWNRLSNLEDLIFFEEISYWTSFLLIIFLNVISSIMFPDRILKDLRRYVTDYNNKLDGDLEKEKENNSDIDDLPIK